MTQHHQSSRSMREVVKWLASGCSGTCRVVGTCFRGAQVDLGVCFVALEQQWVVLSGAEQDVQLLSTDVLIMMWQIWWMREASWWAQCAEWGSVGRARESKGVWEVSWFVVGSSEASGVCP